MTFKKTTTVVTDYQCIVGARNFIYKKVKFSKELLLPLENMVDAQLSTDI